MQKPTISVPEMAAELGIGLTKAYQLVHEPNFPTIRIGTRILIPVDRFHEWLTQESKGLIYLSLLPSTRQITVAIQKK